MTLFRSEVRAFSMNMKSSSIIFAGSNSHVLFVVGALVPAGLEFGVESEDIARGFERIGVEVVESSRVDTVRDDRAERRDERRGRSGSKT